MNSTERAHYIISSNKFMVMATSDAAGKPWVSTVGFKYETVFNFYWISAKDALHSKNIGDRPEITITIFGQLPDGSFDGVYIDAKAYELTDSNNIQTGIKLFAAKNQQPARFTIQSIADVTGNAAWRMYKATPIAVYKRADAMLSGQAITIREKVQL